jgi:type VI secretion system secreted protein VgrG
MTAITTTAQLLQSQDIAFTLKGAAIPPDTLLVHGFSASEGVFDLAAVRLDLVAAATVPVDLHALIDTPATLTVHHRYAGIRHFSGVVAEVERGDAGPHRAAYTMTLLPALHRLRFGSDCRIFQEMSVPDIVSQLLGEYGVTDVRWDTQQDHAPREYCVQYRETHLDFINRLLAEEGIWYHTVHGPEGQHTLRLSDVPDVCPPCPQQAMLEYNATSGGAVRGVYCSRFSVRERVRSTAFTQRDYTFKNPPHTLEQVHAASDGNGSETYHLYDYPGRYKVDGVGRPFTRTRMEAHRVDASTVDGEANTPHLTAGHTVTLTDHPRADNNIKYRLLGVHHGGRQPQALGAEAGDGATTYGCSFVGMPARLPYRPPDSVKPLVDGPQIATVVGPKGEEIYTDEHGRVKVRFPWDRYAKGDEHSSCWIRVAQLWAGTRFGAMFLPRIGHEVVVEFLDGDPDQPLITGRVYNAANRTPYPLPAKKTVSTIKSRSHKSAGANELRFDDATGDEEIFLHAQKDLETRVLNDAREVIGRDRHKMVERDAYENITGDSHRLVEGDSHGQVKGDRHETTDGATLEEVGSSASLKAGTTIVLEAGSQITLKVGGSFISIHGGGVDIVGPIINLNSGGSAGAPDAPVKPTEALEAIAATKSDKPEAIPVTAIEPPQAKALKAAAAKRKPLQKICRG